MTLSGGALFAVENSPIPVKFDRQGHSCNFYADLGPTEYCKWDAVLWRLGHVHVWHAAARGPWLLRTKESKQGISIVKSHPCTGDAREGARSAPFLLTAQWIPFGDHPMKLERYREDYSRE